MTIQGLMKKVIKAEIMTKIAIPTRDNVVDDHFGHCDHYTVFSVDDNKNVIGLERLDSPQGCGCKSNIASVMQEMGITIMLAGNMGMGAFNKLTMHGISVVRGCHGNIEDVLKAYLEGSIADSAESCSHHDCGELTHEARAEWSSLQLCLARRKKTKGQLMEQRKQSEACSDYAEHEQARPKVKYGRME